MNHQTPNYNELRRTVVRRTRRRLFFFANLALWLLFTASMSPYVQTSLNGPRISLGWFVIVIIHSFIAFDVWGRYVDRAVRKEMARHGMATTSSSPHSLKPKRALYLTDDGELEEDESFSESETLTRCKRSDSV